MNEKEYILYISFTLLQYVIPVCYVQGIIGVTKWLKTWN